MLHFGVVAAVVGRVVDLGHLEGRRAFVDDVTDLLDGAGVFGDDVIPATGGAGVAEGLGRLGAEAEGQEREDVFGMHFEKMSFLVVCAWRWNSGNGNIEAKASPFILFSVVPAPYLPPLPDSQVL